MKTAREIIDFIIKKTEVTQYGDRAYDRYSFGVGVAKALLNTYQIDQDTYDDVIDIMDNEFCDIGKII